MARGREFSCDFGKFKEACNGFAHARMRCTFFRLKYLTPLEHRLIHSSRDAALPAGSREIIVSACCSTEDVMSQLKEGFASSPSSSDRTGTFHRGRLAHLVQTAQEPEQRPQGQESDDAVLFVSPPPLPWPRVFPPL